jgi:hypothetical protein
MDTLTAFFVVFLLGFTAPVMGLRALSNDKNGEAGCFLDGMLAMLIFFMVLLVWVGV